MTERNVAAGALVVAVLSYAYLFAKLFASGWSRRPTELVAVVTLTAALVVLGAAGRGVRTLFLVAAGWSTPLVIADLVWLLGVERAYGPGDLDPAAPMLTALLYLPVALTAVAVGSATARRLGGAASGRNARQGKGSV